MKERGTSTYYSATKRAYAGMRMDLKGLREGRNGMVIVTPWFPCNGAPGQAKSAARDAARAFRFADELEQEAP